MFLHSLVEKSKEEQRLVGNVWCPGREVFKTTSHEDFLLWPRKRMEGKLMIESEIENFGN